jgi:hypothetical protein
MTKVFRFVAICVIGVALTVFSIASAQTYTTIDFPSAVTNTLNGGPNPQGTSVGSYTDTSNVIHGFTLTKKDHSTPRVARTRSRISAFTSSRRPSAIMFSI